MMSAALKVLQLGASLFGLRLSPFATGALAAASVAVGLAGAAGYLVHVGASRAEQACEAGALRAQNDALAAELRDKRRSLALITGMAERDAARAEEAEAKLRNNQVNINATPENPQKCFRRAAAGRVRSVR